MVTVTGLRVGGWPVPSPQGLFPSPRPCGHGAGCQHHGQHLPLSLVYRPLLVPPAAPLGSPPPPESPDPPLAGPCGGQTESHPFSELPPSSGGAWQKPQERSLRGGPCRDDSLPGGAGARARGTHRQEGLLGRKCRAPPGGARPPRGGRDHRLRLGGRREGSWQVLLLGGHRGPCGGPVRPRRWRGSLKPQTEGPGRLFLQLAPLPADGAPGGNVSWIRYLK